MQHKSGYDGYIINTKNAGTCLNGKIPLTGELTLKLYYDKMAEHNFNINLKNQNSENGLGISNTKYDIQIKYSNGETKEYTNQTTDEEGNILITDAPGRSSMTIYIKQTNIASGYSKDSEKQYVGIRLNAEGNEIELYGNKSKGITANIENNTLYLVHQNSYANEKNAIRINVKDKTDNDITIQNVKFEISEPNGITTTIESNEEGIAEINNIIAPGKGDFLYEITQIDDIYGYNKIDENIYLNITFDENGIISNTQIISGNAQADLIEEAQGSTKNKIANVEIQLQRGGENGKGPFGDYKIKIIEQDVETNELIEGVRYKIIQKATIQEISHVTTSNKTTSSSGEAITEAMEGEKLLLRLKRSKVPAGYKFDRSEFKVEFRKNADGDYELVEDIKEVTIDNEAKIITIKRTNYSKNSSLNTAKLNVNNEIFITKVDEDLRPLRDVVMELRENSTGATWKLKTDSNGLAKLTNEEIINELGSEFPQHLTSKEGLLTFWITEESVPVGYERIDTDIGFEAYYEFTPEGALEISYMNVLDGLSYYHIVDQEYDQYEEEDYTKVDIKLKVINPYGGDIDSTKLKTLEIEKVDGEDNSIKLSNATFKITVNYPEIGGMSTYGRTNNNGILNFNRLYFPEGKSIVELVETTPPTGYALDKTPIIIEVENTNGQISITSQEPSVQIDENGKIKLKVENIKQEKVVPYGIVIEKRDSETDELIEYLTNFDIAITKQGIQENYSRSTRDGTTSVSGLNGKGPIKIEITETKAPIGYKRESSTKIININKQDLKSSISISSSSSNVSLYGNTIYVTMYNEKDYNETNYVSAPILEIRKVDSKNRDLGLKKAKFKITMPNGRVKTVETLKSGNTATALLGVSGRYTIEEISAPSGYEITKKIALDITFDEYNNIRSCEIVKNLGDEYATSVIQKSSKGKRIYLKIGDSRINKNTTGVSSYSLHIDKVSSASSNLKLDGAKFDVNITQQNGNDYSLTKTTNNQSGAYVYGLYGTGKIVVTLREYRAPSGYQLDGQIKKIVFTRDEQTKQIVILENELVNISRSDISINKYGNMITIKVKDRPITYTPTIEIDGPDTPGEINPSHPGYGNPYNSIIIENEYILDHSVKIQGTTFEIYRLGSYISKGTTNKYGLTTISLGNTQYFTVEEYLIKNVKMQDKRYIKNKDVVLRITYNESGKMQNAEIISGKYDDEGRTVAQVDPDFEYVGGNILKVDIRCDKVQYSGVTGSGSNGTGESSDSPWGGSSGGNGGSGEITGGGTINPTPNPKPGSNILSPIRPIIGELEPDFGVLLEKQHIFNEKIKVKDAQYAIYVYNEDTKESTSKITKTNNKGQILFGGLLGYGNFEITIVELSSPAEYLVDENIHTIRINRDKTSQLITLMENDNNENITTKIDNINKIVNVKIKETPSSIGIAIQKQDYDDDLITLKNAKFEITDVETSEKYELITGEEGIEYINLPAKSNGYHKFRINEIEAPIGYQITSAQITLKVKYLDGIIAEAEIEGENEFADVIKQNSEYIEISVLNKKITEGLKYDIELIKADAYYSSITFKDAKIKLEVDNEEGLKGVVKTTLTDDDGKIYLNNMYGNGKATIKITEIEPPPGRRFDIKPKQVILNLSKENNWIKLDSNTKNVDTYIDNENKKVKIRIRNYPDGTFIMGANKVDANDHSIILTGAEYSVKLEGGNDLYKIKDYKDGLMVLQDIPIPNMSGEYTYTLIETKAPAGYTLDPTPVILKVEVSLINGIKVIKNAYVESGKGQVEKYGEEYVHLLLYDDFDTSISDKGCLIEVVKVDKLNHDHVIPNTLINVQIKAESGETYYKEITTNELGQINLKNIIGTGRIEVILTELETTKQYLKDEKTKTIVFNRNKDTKEITIEKVEGNGIIVNKKDSNVQILFENELNSETAKTITVKKVWQDNSDKAKKRPESIKLQIKNGNDVVESKVINKTYENPENANEWIYIFTGLDKYNSDNNLINYTIDEEAVNTNDLKFYVSEINDETKEITNTFKVPDEMVNEKTSITGYKVWQDTQRQQNKRPNNIKLQAKIGDTVVKEQIITTESNKEVIFENLPKYDENGDEITYIINETEINTGDLKFYESSYNEETKTLTNTFKVPEDMANEKISITGHKVWQDTEKQKNKRPNNIKLQVKIGDTVVKEQIITTESDKEVIFESLPKYDENGDEIVYTIAEIEVNTGDLKFYVSQINQETKTITNTFKMPDEMVNEKTSITGHKVWQDTEEQKVKRPNAIKLQVKIGDTVVKEQTITTENNKDVIFENLPKYDENGDEIVYIIKEKEINVGDLRFYVSNYNEATKTITNIFKVPEDMANEKISITGHKVWQDTEEQKAKRPNSIKLQIKVGNTLVKQEIITTESNKDVIFENLPKYDSNGNEIVYLIDESEINAGDLKFYVSSIDQATKTITNTFKIPEDTLNISVTKKWDDSNDAMKMRPESIILKILNKNQEVARQTLVGNKNENTWTYTFSNLPKYNVNGNEIEYLVDEAEANANELKYYTKSINQETKTITNTYIINASIKKISKNTKIGLGGAEITLIDETGTQVTGTTNEQGYITFINLEKGKTYKYKETKAPLGYNLNNTEYTLTVNENGSIIYGSNNGIIEDERITTSVTIIKYEEGTKNPLSGAEIGIYNEEGNLIVINGQALKGVTGENGQITFNKLEPGTYYYKEITAPIGYLVNENSYKFIVNEDGTIVFENDTKGILYNKKYVVDVTIRKVIKGTDTGIPGAEITLIDDKNNEYVARTNVYGYVTFSGAQVGKTYKYKETKAPLGYNLNENEYSFKVEANGIIVDITGNRIIENERITVSVSIIKYEEGTTNPLPGAEIGIYNEEGKLIAIKGQVLKGVTGENGQVTFNKLEPGIYYYKEITAPIGYLVNENSYKFAVNEDGTITFENDTKGILYNKKHVVDVTIRKVIKGTTIGLPGAEITLIDDKNNEYKAITNQEGYVIFKGVQVGKTYRYKETKAPIGYNLNESEYSFKVEANGIIVDITGNRIIENERITTSVTIIKYEEGTTNPLPGAEIGIYNEEGKLIAINGQALKGVTGENGQITFNKLEPGTYYYKEITAPIGYLINENSYKFVVNADGTITFENDTKGILYNKKHVVDVTIRKVIKGTTIGLPGAEITLIDDKNNEYKAITNQEGYVIFKGVQAGKTYKYKETKAPLKYRLNTTEYSFRIAQDETIVDITGNRIIEDEKITGNVEIIKYKYGTVVGIEGAEIGIYDKTGKILVIDGKEQIGLTNKQGKIIFKGLEPGIYYYKEIKAPLGYKLNNNSYRFIINNSGETVFEDVTNGIIYNSLFLIEVPIRKMDALTKLGLPGAEITLIDDKNNEYKAITNQEGYAIFKDLQAGKTYTYKETKAPTGYIIDSNSYKFTINADGTITDITGNRIILNNPVDEEIQIPIWKIDALTKLGIAGVEITLTDEQGKEYKAITNKDGYVTFTKLKRGSTYYYKETKAPAGYKPDETKYSFKIEIDGTITDIIGKRIIENYPIASVRIRKIDSLSKKGIAGAKIGLYDIEGNPLTNEQGKQITGITDEQGYVTFKGLPIGTIYYYKEIIAPKGYILNNNLYSFKIDAIGTIIDIDGTRIIENNPILGEIEIYKAEAGTTKYLANTKIAIYNYESYIKGETYIEELTTNTDGKVHFKNLPIGKYVCKETKAPEGYNLDSKPIVFEINEEGEVVIEEGKIIFENTPIEKTDNPPQEEPKDPEIPNNNYTPPDFVPDTKIPQTGQKAVGVASVILILTLSASGIETVILYNRYKKAKEYERMKQKITKM